MFINQDLPYKVADISLSDWGRKEIEIAEKETDNVFVTAWEAELKNSLANQPTD